MNGRLRPRFFGTNLKMHQTAQETASYIAGLAADEGGSVQCFVIPPFTSLAAAIDTAHTANILVGAQNMHWAGAGEFTGEISGRMLRALGVDLVLIGHAERRQSFGETDVTVRLKVEAALANDLVALVCVGESGAERRSGAAVDTVMRQARLALSGIEEPTRVIVAYEPVWAIGDGSESAEPEAIADVIAALREWLGATPLLYGGSVDAQTASRYAALPGIDGLFVGRAAWTPEGFRRVLAAAAL